MSGEDAMRELLVLSASSEGSLSALTRHWVDYLGRSPDVSLRQVTGAAAVRQRHLKHRAAFVAASTGELKGKVAAFSCDETRRLSRTFKPGSLRVAFVFSGAGSQWMGMGYRLFQSEPVFRRALIECDAALATELGWSVLELLAPTAEAARLDRAEGFQSAIFSLQVGLARLWRSWGVEPTAVVGHSMGEVAAAHVAGCLSLEDASKVIARRSRLQASCSGRGTAAMVGLSSGEASSVIAPYGERVSIAAVNAPRMIVIAGARGAIEAIVEGLSAKDVFCRPIKGAGAAPHSPEMDSIIEPLRQQLEGLTPQEGGVPFYSTVEGHCVSGSVLDAAYWGRNLRQPVRFAESIEAMAPHVDCFIEMSGHPVLAAAVDETLSQLSDRAFASTRVLPSLRRDTDEREVLLTTAGVLYTLGHELQWSAVCPGSGAVGPDVPLYEHLDFRRPSETATPPAPPTSMSLSPAQEALLALDKLQGALERERAQRHEPIAIVGLGCRFAGGANTPEQLWTLFEEGADCVSEISDARAGVLESWYDPAGSPGKTAVRSAAFLDFSTLSEFEPQFFDISPREAVSMDPQQRLLLEVAYEALERAGLANERLAATKTGVFVGLCGSDYWWDLARYPKAIDMFTLTGNFHSFSAGRISYALDLKGPAFAIDTACSSSLVAIHQAVQSLRARECDVALAGGANVISPFSMMFTSKMPAVAQDGRTKAFDAAADGTTRGEGCGMVALKRLADAEAAGDPVLAIIKGSAVNHDGRSNGLTAPSVHAQEQVIKDALNDANLSAADVDYVEAHGAGTSLGDPIEIEALKATYGAPLVNGRSCVVSAAKTNIGHTEAAAGVAALIKVVLSLQHQLIPGVRHLERLNPHIDLDNTRLVISKDPQAWLPLGQQARRAGVSAFGASGTNAHLIVEQAAPRTVETHADESPQILALSARTERALERRIQDLKALVRDSDLEFSDVCFSSNVGRAHHPHRVAAVAFSLGEALERLAAQEPISTPSTRRHVFRFSPVGESLAAMRADLSREPLGQAVLQRLESKWLKVRAGASRIDATPEAPVGNEQFVHFAASIAVAELWRGFGITPGLIVAEESTQLAAAVVAGILSESDAIEYLAKETDADRLTLHWERSAVDVQQGQWRAGTSDSVLWIGEPERNDAFDCVWASDGSRASILRAVAELYRSGASIDFREVHRARPQRMLALPTYPFDRRKYWAPVLERVSAIADGSVPDGLRCSRVDVAGTEKLVFERSVSAADPDYFGDHRLFGTAILPATAQIEMMLVSAFPDGLPPACVIEDLNLEEAVALPERGVRRVQVVFEREGEKWREAQLFSGSIGRSHAEWSLNSRARLGSTAWAPADFPSLPLLRERIVQVADPDTWYQKLAAVGFQFGPTFQAIERAWVGPGEALVEVTLPDPLDTHGYAVHPVLLDGAFQSAGLALGDAGSAPRLPVMVERLTLRAPFARKVICHARVRSQQSETSSTTEKRFASDAIVDFRLYSPEGRAVGEATGVRLKAMLSRASLGLQASGALDWLYEVAWKHSEFVAQPPAPETKQTWLVFGDQGGVGEAVSSRLVAQKQRTMVVLAGASWSMRDNYCTICPTNSEHYRNVIEALDTEVGGDLAGVLYCWGLDESGQVSCGDSHDSLRGLVELLSALGSERTPPIAVVSRGSQVVNEGEVPDAGGAMLWGLGRALEAERPGQVRLIDLDREMHASYDVDCVVAELHPSNSELEVAYRKDESDTGGARWVSRLRAVRPTQISAKAYQWRSDATYLILGGLGSVGLALAQRMAAGGAGRVVLAGRSKPSSRQDALLTSLARRCDVTYVRADVSRASEVLRLLTAASDSACPLRGVVHAAVALSDGVVSNQDWARFEHVLAPKVEGSLNLETALVDLGLAEQLDFLAYFSSGASVVGSAGQTNYAAANAFQDALAHQVSSSGRRVFSVNWGAFDIGDVGDRLKLSEQRGVAPVEPQLGLALFEHLILGCPAQVAVLPFRWGQVSHALGEQLPHPRLLDLLRERGGRSATGQVEDAATVREAVMAADEPARPALIEAHVRKVVAHALWLEPAEVDVGAPLSSLGMDSLVALQIKHRLEKDLGTAIPMVQLLSGAPIARLSKHLAEACGDSAKAAADEHQEVDSKPSEAEAVARVSDLSDAEVMEQLQQLLAEG